MSRIAGLLRIDGAPIDPTLPGRVVAALAPGDADGSGVHRRPAGGATPIGAMEHMAAAV